jgi:exopolyphosphatase/guanosine-5'-triphosphate,3'-diphosphate pyrophosphatase
MINTFAVIDIGSNSVRLVVYDTNARPPRQLVNERVYCGLGRDLGKTGKLSPDGVFLAFAAFSNFCEILNTEKPDALEIVATAALREALDGQDFIGTVKDKFGFDIRVISGEEEASFAARGVMALDPAASGVVADFGGGSLEFARIGHGEIGEVASYPFGAFRVLALGEEAPEILKQGFQGARRHFSGAREMYLIGGSWRALAKCFLQEKGLDPAAYDKTNISPLEAQVFCERIENAPVAELTDKFHLDVRRAGLLPVSALVLRQVVLALMPERIAVSSAGVRDGVVYNSITRAGPK